MKIWIKMFDATYRLDNGVIVLDDSDIPLPEVFPRKPELRWNVIFPPQTRAGDHYHPKRHELFVAFGEGMELLVEEKNTKEVTIYKMDPEHHDGKCAAFWMKPGIPHAMRNVSDKPGYLIEFASELQESVAHVVGDGEE